MLSINLVPSRYALTLMFQSGLGKYSEAVLTFFWLFIGSGQVVSARPFSSSAGTVLLLYFFTLLIGKPYCYD